MFLKTRCIILLLIIYFQLVSSQRKTLKKRLILERLESIYANSKYLKLDQDFIKLDRKSFSYNANLTIYQDVDFPTKIKIQLYKFASNTYKKTAFFMQVDFCQFFEYVDKYVANQAVFKDWIKKCPLKKGEYKVVNLNSDLIDLSILPAWKFKAEMENYSDVVGLLAKQNIYFTIVEEY